MAGEFLAKAGELLAAAGEDFSPGSPGPLYKPYFTPLKLPKISLGHRRV